MMKGDTVSAANATQGALLPATILQDKEPQHVNSAVAQHVLHHSAARDGSESKPTVKHSP